MAKKNSLANNPLFDTVTAEKAPVASADQSAESRKKGRPRNEELVRDNSAQAGLPEEYTRASFILKVSALNDLKNYAYTNRMSIKDALSEILEEFFEGYKAEGGELLQHKK